MNDPTIFEYEAMGTFWKVTFFESVAQVKHDQLYTKIRTLIDDFEGKYSRFKSDSLVAQLSRTVGVVEVPHDLVAMMRIYERLYDLSDGMFTPLVGALLEDLGYDSSYSGVPKEIVRDIPTLHEALLVVDDTHLEIKIPMMLDLGAVGKGYFVDVLFSFLKAEGFEHFLVDGSGDVRYASPDRSITVGLEHPKDLSLVIGTYEMYEGAMCSSATNRRRWSTYSHYLNPVTKTSPEEVLATWVVTKEAAIADALSTVLFFTPPEKITGFDFEYCVINKELRIKKSPGFLATFY